MNFIFFGDSICTGQFVSPHKCWVTRIGVELEKRRPSLRVMNASRNGDTTRSALERIAYDVQAHRMECIYIQFGMNDCNYWKSDICLPRVSKSAFETNLSEIIDRAQVFGAKTIFLATNHPSPKGAFEHYPTLSYQTSNEQYNKSIRRVADSKKTHLIDHEKEWVRLMESGVDIENLLLPDKIHLSEGGHDIYFSILRKEMTNLLL